jgi:hypothetical protein
MRTTIRLNDKLLLQAKRKAAGSRRTMTAIIEDALRESLARRRRPPRGPRIRLTTVKGKGTLPGVDLDDGASLLDRMEE